MNAQKWEYLTQPVQTTDLKTLGEQGWRLVAIDGGIMFFERPVEDEKPAKK